MNRILLSALAAMLTTPAAAQLQPGMTIDFVGDWCAPFHDDATNSTSYKLPSWTDDGSCTGILSIDKSGFEFLPDKLYCAPVELRTEKDIAPSGTTYIAKITARCGDDGRIKLFQFERYKGNLFVKPK